MSYHFSAAGGGFTPPLPSTADRAVALTSRAHFCGHVVIGDDTSRGAISGSPARVVQVESHLELCWCLCLSLRPDIADLREQVAFDWCDDEDRQRTHYFDLFVTRTDGYRIACAVRPADRVHGRLGVQLPQIAAQARASGFADDVRLLTDRDLNPVELHNARLLHGIRERDPGADAAATRVVTELSSTATLAELTSRTGLGIPGFRALLRLVRSGHLCPVHLEEITKATVVFKRSAL